MIDVLEWDSSFFKRKIGEMELKDESLAAVKSALQKAKDNAFKYITCKLQNHKIDQSRRLESLGFYLSDIRITWAINSEKFACTISADYPPVIRTATDNDIRALQDIAKSLFSESLFYNDPFFSKEEADSLYQTWISNSVKGEAADIVLYVPEKGFISCKKTTADEGRIVLIGVKEDFRGKSLGRGLMKEAIKWFETQGISRVWVRTQLSNLIAMNFYNKLGFYIKEYDMVYAKIL
jgi:dTDP-4-amino-4,6-dideoxy-D-galactose acyltransferase